ncbi:uncharacterized protein LOC114518995 [Dendronephthya gigantea]|uniref:uncharacterized protein LOC114518995 n=1 Tax=Dendronephthya gigantea TaxID=151771 RepID=UPI00106A3DC7|nr:uncharacterized protein LOC114518995 [Dendronephthya gigantea]
MANLMRIFAQSFFSRQSSKYLFYKCMKNYSCNTGGRFSFMLRTKWGTFLKENHSFTTSYLIVTSHMSRFLHVGTYRSRSVETSREDDHEFVTEEISMTDKKFEDFSDIMKTIKEKTGVLLKAVHGKDGKEGWRILVGGTRHEVQRAVLHLKSSTEHDSINQRLLLLQDDTVHEKNNSRKEKPIWAYYRRNFKGQKPPMRTRKKCIRGTGESQIVSGNPCPVCRLQLAGQYQLNYKDIDLLSQFISPHTGEIFEASKTGVCRYQQNNLKTAIQTAKDYGLLPYSIPGPRSIEKPVKSAEIPVNVRLK